MKDPIPVKSQEAVPIQASAPEKTRSRPPKVKMNEEEGATGFAPAGDHAEFGKGFVDALGTSDNDLAHHLLSQVFGTIPRETKASDVNAQLALMHAIGPKDALEALLVVQMAGVHSAAMEMLRRVIDAGGSQKAEAYSNQATKMLRTFTAQMQALNSHRGKGQQKVTVEHVTVNAGGQAIVGVVDSKGEGGKKNEL